ncbi:O-antigen/teichoic acid export membrane protein [Aliiruegeria haliotis]|uniref:O-antigen/teichoic acid export membrane protein n=1 Tax=Aliiruegeria haliotis TaxID=1280846 RepID=A0A2T0RST6_9RHOB|nr:oligosaccharide flippase family protein [Aliiruegeria haliotis]PRY24228.1 O-antigen/teichoic acid export membrane protein [Aliiruegeria haliotis]
MRALARRFRGDGRGARALRGSAFATFQFGTAQLLRLASNLILTRLLFPEAFGTMAIVNALITGLALFTDTGLRASIIQNARGDDPDFLNTAWTIQIIRGGLLWLVILACAAPVSQIYGAPELATILPVIGLGVFVAGFTPTAVHRAERHLRIGRLTAISLSVQLISIIVTIIAAYVLRSVWALVIGNLVNEILLLVARRLFLPDNRNRLRLEPEALRSIVTFGKFILLSTAAAFVISQGDRVILGLYISRAELGVYSVGFVLATVAVQLNNMLGGRILFPLYSMAPPNASASNRSAIFRAQRLVGLCALTITSALAFAGPALVDVLYDPRYALAGPIVTLQCLSVIPLLTLRSAQALLPAMGDSKRLLILQVSTAVLQTAILFAGIHVAGVAGAILAPGLAALGTWPLAISYCRKYVAFDPVAQFGLTCLGIVLCGAAVLLHAERIVALFP